MGKKIFKTTLKIFGGIILLLALLYGLFHLWEYASGGKFVKYLRANSETVGLEESFSYDVAKGDIENSKLIMVGEAHGFEEPTKFDVHFFKYLNANFNVKNYFAELDFVQAEYLNRYLLSKDEKLLEQVLKYWVVIQGRNNRDYFDKYVNFQEYYQEVTEERKFRFIGIDKIQDWSLTTKYLNELIPPDQNIEPLEFGKEQFVERLLNQIDALTSFYSENTDTLLKISHIRKNVEFVRDKVNREEVMFSNFYSIYQKEGLGNRKVYGYFGLYHIFQYRINGAHPLASKIRQSDLGLENKMLSFNFLMNDAHMVTSSKRLPAFLRDEGAYTRMPVSADNMLVMYIYGIKDYKRMTAEHHKSLVKMNADKNPYTDSRRLNTMFQLLPVTDLFELNDIGKPYTQYTIFVRNSDWAEPMTELNQ
jgi:hypothetical protein